MNDQVKVDEIRRPRAGHEVPDNAPTLPTACLGRTWTPTMVLGAMAMVSTGEWWQVPLRPTYQATTMAYRLRAVGLDATASAGVCYVARPNEPREPRTQQHSAPYKHSAPS